jgi:hypothetical protein
LLDLSSPCVCGHTRTWHESCAPERCLQCACRRYSRQVAAGDGARPACKGARVNLRCKQCGTLYVGMPDGTQPQAFMCSRCGGALEILPAPTVTVGAPNPVVSVGSAVGGAAIGGAIGGPPGAIVGGILGLLIGVAASSK